MFLLHRTRFSIYVSEHNKSIIFDLEKQYAMEVIEGLRATPPLRGRSFKHLKSVWVSQEQAIRDAK